MAFNSYLIVWIWQKYITIMWGFTCQKHVDAYYALQIGRST